MGKTLIRFIILSAVAAITLFIAGLNRDPISLTLGPSLNFQTTSGILLLASFAVGVGVAGLVGLYFSVRSYIRERRAVNLLSSNIKTREELTKALSLAAEGNLVLAETELTRLKKKNPEDLFIAKELADVKVKKGDIKGALLVIEDLRQKNIKEPLLLLKASELYSLTGNATASLDNLILLTKSNTSPDIAKKTRDIAIKAGKFEEALEAHKKLESNSVDNKVELQTERASIEIELLLKNSEKDTEELVQEIQAILRKAPNCGKGYEALRNLYKKQGNHQDAAELGSKAGRLLENINLLKDSASEFITLQQPAKAIAAIKSAVAAWNVDNKIHALLLLADTATNISMFGDAKTALDEAYILVLKSKNELKPQVLTRLARLHIKTGNVKEALQLWEEMYSGEKKETLLLTGNIRELPSPELSTP